eukprot:CAMPEP_0184501382 /NCGR_PEP_ID=MMETSP0113_2-20130426/47496_1 /TAXON_ID=91329 /ORGANISM="Norrisiella sphaerica, Strain BC52" /LENGTH=30 /DNA_ID= /DNA_START= /DNA_END= /DNA_ORIENTATION=
MSALPQVLDVHVQVPLPQVRSERMRYLQIS